MRFQSLITLLALVVVLARPTRAAFGSSWLSSSLSVWYGGGDDASILVNGVRVTARYDASIVLRGTSRSSGVSSAWLVRLEAARVHDHAWRQRVVEPRLGHGQLLHHYLPDDTFVVYIDRATAVDVAGLAGVRWVRRLPREAKLAASAAAWHAARFEDRRLLPSDGGGGQDADGVAVRLLAMTVGGWPERLHVGIAPCHGTPAGHDAVRRLADAWTALTATPTAKTTTTTTTPTYEARVVTPRDEGHPAATATGASPLAATAASSLVFVWPAWPASPATMAQAAKARPDGRRFFALLDWLLAQDLVLSIEASTISAEHGVRARNEAARWIVATGNETTYAAGAWAGRSLLSGAGQLVACADTGLDVGHCMFADPARTTPASLHRKVTGYAVIGGGDRSDLTGGHGTHVVGTIVGQALFHTNASIAVQRFDGLAPRARVYFQDVAGASGSVAEGLRQVSSLAASLLLPAYEAGARVHVNAWSTSETAYTAWARQVDSFVEAQPGMLVLCAAGTDRFTRSSLSGRVGSPATCKNCLAVGASQTGRQARLDTLDFVDWAGRRREVMNVLSVNDIDCCGDAQDVRVKRHCCRSYVAAQLAAADDAWGEENMWALSAHGVGSALGPGRAKPDLVAPGDHVVSAHARNATEAVLSGVAAGQCSGPSMQQSLTAKSGASMATAVVAGAALLIREYLSSGYYPGGVAGSGGVALHQAPSAALVAAVLLVGARPLTGRFDANNDGNTNDDTWPLTTSPWRLDSLQASKHRGLAARGFGKPELAESLWFAPSADSPANGNSGGSASSSSVSPAWRLILVDKEPSVAGGDVTYCVQIRPTATTATTTEGGGETAAGGGSTSSTTGDEDGATASTLTVVLAYHDVAAQIGAANSLVNDLDLIVTVSSPVTSSSSSSVEYRRVATLAGNFNTQRDATNNYERVDVRVRAGDLVHVIVRGTSVPVRRTPAGGDAQLFSLAVKGHFERSAFKTESYCEARTLARVAWGRFPTRGTTGSDTEWEPWVGLIVGGGLLLLVLLCVWGYIHQRRSTGGHVYQTTNNPFDDFD